MRANIVRFISVSAFEETMRL